MLADVQKMLAGTDGALTKSIAITDLAGSKASPTVVLLEVCDWQTKLLDKHRADVMQLDSGQS